MEESGKKKSRKRIQGAGNLRGKRKAISSLSVDDNGISKKKKKNNKIWM